VRFERWVLPGVLLVTALAYLNALDGGFIWDDHALIESQPQVKELASLSTYFGQMFWSDPLDIPRRFYRPLVIVSYALDYRVWGANAFGFHLSNVLFHLVSVAWVFLLGRKAGASAAAAGLTAAFFGLFPRLTESVTWISGRTDVLASLFGFAALLVYSTDPKEGSRRVGAGVLALLGLFCKEVAGVVLVAVFVLEGLKVFRKERSIRQAFLHLLPMGGAAVAYVALRLNATHSDVRVQWVTPDAQPVSERLVAALATVGEYARMLVYPWVPQTQIGEMGHYPALLLLFGFAALAGVLALLWTFRSRLSDVQWALFLAAGAALAMVLHVIPLDVDVLAADRFLYVPVALGVVPLGPVLDSLMQKRALPVLALGGAVLLSFVGATYVRNTQWADEYRFWKQAVEATGPDAALPAMQLGLLLMEEGLYAKALPYVERSVRARAIIPAYSNLALCQSRLGRHAEAIGLYQDIIRKMPTALRAHFNLVMSLARAQRFEEAEKELESTRALLPSHVAIPEIRALIERSRKSLAELPPPSPSDPPELRVKRAEVFEDLTATHEAALAWDLVLQAPALTQAQLTRATGVLVINHDLPHGERALERLAKDYPEAAELPALREHLEAKRRLE
jgi:protein O-mannosyl-transferase